MHLNSNGTLAFLNHGGTNIGNGTTVLQASTWYSIQAKIGTGASSTYEIRINGVQEFTTSTASVGTVNNGSILLGGGSSYTDVYYYDDVEIDDAAYPALRSGNLINLNWLSIQEYPRANFQAVQRSYFIAGGGPNQQLLTPMDLFVPSQFVAKGDHVTPQRPSRANLTGIPGFATTDLLGVTPGAVYTTQLPQLTRLPRTVNPGQDARYADPSDILAVTPSALHATQLPQLTRLARTVNLGQDARYADPYLSIPPTGWLRHEDPPRRIKPWIQYVSPYLSFYLSDPMVLTPYFEDQFQDRGRPASKPMARPQQAQIERIDPSLTLPFPVPFLVQDTFSPLRQKVVVDPTPLSYGPVTTSYADPSQMAFIFGPHLVAARTRVQVSPSGTDFLPIVSTVIVGLPPVPGSWNMPTDRLPVLARRAGAEQLSTANLPPDQQGTGPQAWNLQQADRPKAIRLPDLSNQVLTAAITTTFDLPFAAVFLQTESRKAGHPSRVTLGPAPWHDGTSYVTTVVVSGDDPSALRVWDVPAQLPYFLRGLDPARRQEAAQFAGNLPGGISLIAGPPFIVVDLFVYVAGAYQAAVREE